MAVTDIFFVLALLCGAVLCEYGITISNAKEMIQFSKQVNSGTTFKGTTVYLANDIDLSGVSGLFNPIGMFSYRGYICYETDDEYDECNYDEYFTSFEGDFDGQGYMINGLRMKSSLYYVGIFGYSSGMSAKNVVIGPSCSFVGTTHYNFSAVGSLIGVSDGSSYIEGVVNMAHVSFDGDVSVESEVGGIAGYVDGKFKNCINFGSVSNSGRAKLRSYTGGIVGDGASAYNCINYGTVSVGFKSDSLYAGGITGDSSRSAKNCVSAGKIKLSKSAKNANNYYVGAITPGGSGNSANCHCASNVGYTSGCSVVGLDSTTVSELNSYAEDKGYDSWYTFHLKGGRIGNKKDEVLCMIPDYPLRPAKSYNTFSYWCLSEKCSLESIIDGSGMGSSLDFYAKWKVDAGLVIGTVIAIVACPAAIFLVVGAFLYVGIVENKMKVNRESIDIALSWLKKLRSSSKGVAVTLQQMETLKIVDECIDKKFSQNSTKSADTNKSVCEILEEINIK